MSRDAPIPCIVCDKALENVDEAAENQPHKGTTFTSGGHYGSTAFDPMNGEFLEINICDDCLRKRAEQGKVMIGRERKPLIYLARIRSGDEYLFMPSRFGWTKAHRALVRWRPDMEDDDDDLLIESAEEYFELRAQGLVESWFKDDEIRAMFARAEEGGET